MVRREIKERRRKEENCFSWRKQFDCFVTSTYIPFLSRLCDVHPTHALTHTYTQTNNYRGWKDWSEVRTKGREFL